MDPADFYNVDLPMYSTYLQFKGVWDMQDLYEYVASFFHKNKFKFYEEKYVYKTPSPFGSDVKHMWKATRLVEAYYKFVIDIYIHTFDTHEVEVVGKDGQKKMLEKGRLWIQFRGHVETDYEKKWEQSSFYAHLRNFYHKYVVMKKAEAIWWDNLYYTVFLKMQSLIKEKLKMESEGFEHRYFHKVR